jgi:ribosome biogenesis protein Nip4
MGEKGVAYRGFWWGNLKERYPIRRPRRRWEDNIKMDIREEGCGSRDWIELAQDRDRWRALVKEVIKLRVP